MITMIILIIMMIVLMIVLMIIIVIIMINIMLMIHDGKVKQNHTSCAEAGGIAVGWMRLFEVSTPATAVKNKQDLLLRKRSGLVHGRTDNPASKNQRSCSNAFIRSTDATTQSLFFAQGHVTIHLYVKQN